MIKNRFWVLLARKTSGEILAEEEKELQQLLTAHPEYHVVLEALDGMQPEERLSGVTKDKFTRQGWEKLSQALEENESVLKESDEAFMPYDPDIFSSMKRVRFSWKLAAAILILVVAGSSAWWWKPAFLKSEDTSIATDNINQVSTKNGSRTKVEMPDGSIVWLNGGSRLTYTDGFSMGNRKVNLEGEGYFDIKKDPEHPFVIQTSQVFIKVLGTSFNVRAYHNEGKTTTTLIQGKVEVQVKSDPEKRIVLRPNEKLTVIDSFFDQSIRATKPLKYEISNIVPDTISGIPQEDIAWVSNKLVFKNESFGEVVFKMERWYDVKFIFKDKSLKKEILTGAFGKETLEEALSALQLTTPFHYSIRGDKVYIEQ